MKVKELEFRVASKTKEISSPTRRPRKWFLSYNNMTNLELKFEDIFPFLVVALFWGVTNPLIEKYSRKEESKFEPMNFSLSYLFSIIKRWRFLAAFCCNQLGSVLYAYLLGVYPEQFSCIAANALTVVITFIAESTMKRHKISIQEVFGLILIVSGIFLILWFL